MVICLLQISKGVQNKTQIVYLLGLLTIVKVIVPINTLCKKKTHQCMSIRYVIIPAIFKHVLYLQALFCVLFLEGLLIPIFVLVSFVLMELLTFRTSKCTNIKVSHFIMETFTVLAYFMLAGEGGMEIQWGWLDVMGVIVGGCFCLGSCGYLHGEIIASRSEDPDSILSLQYPIQLLCTCITLTVISLINGSPAFSQLLMHPIHLFILLFVWVIYECLCFEMWRKLPPKYLYITQLTAILWYDVYSFQLNVFKYISTFASLLSVVVMLDVSWLEVCARCKQLFERKSTYNQFEDDQNDA